MSAQMVGLALGSTSSEVTSQPSSSKALPIEPVPENNSSRRCGMGSSKIFFFHDGVKRQPHQSNKSCAIAGETEVAEQRLSPVHLVGHLFVVDRIRKETDRRNLGNSFQNGSPTWRRSHQLKGRQIPAGRISALEHDAVGRNPLRALLLRQKRAGVRTSQPGARAHSRNGKDRGAAQPKWKRPWSGWKSRLRAKSPARSWRLSCSPA